MMEQFDRYMYLPETAFKKVLPGICDPIQSMGQSVFEMCIDSVGEGLMFYTGHNLPLAQQFCEQLSQYSPADVSRCKAAAKAQKEAQDAGRQAPLCE